MTGKTRAAGLQYIPVLEELDKVLNKLTLVEQQTAIELLATRHIMRASYPDMEKIPVILRGVIKHIGQFTEQAVEGLDVQLYRD